MARCRTVAVCFASLLTVAVVAPGSVRTSAQAQAEPNREELACRLLPIAEVEALSGTKAGMPPHGYHSDADSTCMVSFGNDGGFVRVVSASPEAPGVAPTVQGQLGALRSKIVTGQYPPKVETRDYGNVGCLGITFTSDPQGRAYDKPIHQTICLQLTGGYLLLHLASHNDPILSDEHVKALLAKAAERRKGLG